MTSQLIICPACRTQYQVGIDDIGPDGRNVRCTQCKESWFVTLSAAQAPIPADPDLLALQDNLEAAPAAVASSEVPSAAETSTEQPAQPHQHSADAHPAAASAPDLFDEPAPDRAARYAENGAMPRSALPDGFGAASAASSANAAITAPASRGADVMMRDLADAKRLARRRRTIALIWLIPLLLVIVAAILAYIYRQPIVNRIPQTATLYGALNIPVKETGLLIDPPIARTAVIEGQAIITIEGHVRNISRHTQSIPLIEMTLHDGAGQTLTQWFVEPARATLDPNDRLAFRTEYTDPPGEVVGLRYRFVNRS